MLIDPSFTRFSQNGPFWLAAVIILLALVLFLVADLSRREARRAASEDAADSPPRTTACSPGRSRGVSARR